MKTHLRCQLNFYRENDIHEIFNENYKFTNAIETGSEMTIKCK